MARIGIDAHAIGSELTGNETYVSNLISGITQVDSGHELVLFFTKEEARTRWQEEHPGIEMVSVKPDQPFVRIPLVMPYLVRRHAIELLHVQYVGPPLLSVPLVSAIHDISFETHPEFFSRREVIQFRSTFRFSAMRAARVLTISEHSKRDLMEIYGLPEEKVVVTYLAPGPEFVPVEDDAALDKAAMAYNLEPGYILTVGNLQPRKNMERLISAYTRLRNAREDIKAQLVIVGKKAWRSDPIFKRAQGSRWADDIILTDYVPGEELPALYSGASLFVYPSLYEGFGLPPLEAMACGTPVVTSDRASLPEVVGDAGLMTDPYDIDSIAAAIAAVLLEPELADSLRRSGLERAGQFSWTRCARETLDVYEEVLREAAAG